MTINFKFTYLLPLFLVTILNAAVASPAPEVPDATVSESSVEVAGIRDPEWKPYRTLLLGFAAFDKGSALAPTAVLRFAVRPLNPATSMDGVTLRLAGSAESVPVPLDSNLTFSLPRSQAAADDGAELLVNRKKKTLTIRPDVRTPGLAANVRRLGDLRLECQVRWTIQKDELSFIQRNAFRLIGGPCSSAKVKTFYIADRLISAAWLVGEGRKEPIEIAAGGAIFRPPLHDASWSNDTQVTMEFIAPKSAEAVEISLPKPASSSER